MIEFSDHFLSLTFACRLFSSLQILPVTIGIDLHLLYPSSADVRGNPSLPKLEVNHFVDTILHTVYAAGTLSPQQSRKIFFSSRSPTVCTALNWKQPNCESSSSI